MIIIDAPQGSTEWMESRFWRLTASQMSKSITSTGKLSKSEAAMSAIDKLIAGLDLANTLRQNPELISEMDDYHLQKFISQYTGEKFTGNKFTQRGNELEPDAIDALSKRIGMPITEVGMCIMGDNPNGVVSCSPDGLVYNDEGKLISGVEVKSPSLCTFFGYVHAGLLPDEYKLQVHSSMAICEVDHWHFAAFFPGKPLFYVRVERDQFTEALHDSLVEFRGIYQNRYQEVMTAINNLTVSGCSATIQK